jgi:DNA-binding MarR family transcriptional regulator
VPAANSTVQADVSLEPRLGAARLHRHLAGRGFDDLGPSFGVVFRMLEQRELSLREVAARLGITPQGALKVVNDMVDKGYVVRSEHEADARIKPLGLTARGRAAIAEARRFHARFERDLGKQIGVKRTAALREALEAHLGEDLSDNP